MSVISLQKFKEDNSPHLTGEARCVSCKHDWAAVAPVGTVELECPSCSLMTGRFINTALRGDEYFECFCGCNLFMHHRDGGAYCAKCAEWKPELTE